MRRLSPSCLGDVPSYYRVQCSPTTHHSPPTTQSSAGFHPVYSASPRNTGASSTEWWTWSRGCFGCLPPTSGLAVDWWRPARPRIRGVGAMPHCAKYWRPLNCFASTKGDVVRRVPCRTCSMPLSACPVAGLLLGRSSHVSALLTLSSRSFILPLPNERIYETIDPSIPHDVQRNLGIFCL